MMYFVRSRLRPGLCEAHLTSTSAIRSGAPHVSRATRSTAMRKKKPQPPRPERSAPRNPSPVRDSNRPVQDAAASSVFPIVGIGASAGGLEAIQELLRALPSDTGMAFVIVQHLSPTHSSMLAEILSRSTRMGVVVAQGELTVEPNHTYVIPPAHTIGIANGVLSLSTRSESGGQHRPIDRFFSALAEDRGHQAIGVVLSGTGTDGTLVLQAIKAEGGITFAQNDTAQQDSMPR